MHVSFRSLEWLNHVYYLYVVFIDHFSMTLSFISWDLVLRDVTVPETLSVVFEENNGKLVLISGPLDVPDPLLDEKYGISIKAAKLRKVVQVDRILVLCQLISCTCLASQVYQWFETEDQKSAEANEISDNHNHEKTYSYDTDWYIINL